MQSESSNPLFRSALVFSVFTTFSRVLGYARDAAIFIVFGAGVATDAFLVAFRLPNFLRRLFGEGALSQAFVPVFQEYRDKKGQAEAHELANRTAGTLGVAVSVITVAGILAAPILIAVFAPGFVGKEESFDLSAYMLRITFPYLLFVSLTALISGVVNSYGRFGPSAFAPVLLNISLIAAALWLAPLTDEPITALAWGVLFGGIIQLAFQYAFLRRLGFKARLRLGFDHPGVRRIARLMTPAALSSAVMQVNLLFDTMIASFLVAGSISWLYISDRFVELPLALFGIAISTVILPRLSTHYVQEARKEFHGTLEWGVRASLLLALPCVAGLVLLAGPIFTSLVQYREFGAHDTSMASMSLIAYSAGLPAFMLVKILAVGFYACQNPARPMKIAVIAMLANVVLNIALVLTWTYFERPGAHASLALATSIASWLNCALLYRALKREGVFVVSPDTPLFLAKVIVATLVMSAALWWSAPPLQEWVALGEWWQRILMLAGFVIFGALIYLATLILMRVRLSAFLQTG